MDITEERGQWQGLSNGSQWQSIQTSHQNIWPSPISPCPAPGPHLKKTHMPTQAFTKLSLWNKSFQPNLATPNGFFFCFKDQNVCINNFGKHNPSLIISASTFTQIKYEFMNQSHQSVVRKTLISVLYLRMRLAHVFHYPRENPGTKAGLYLPRDFLWGWGASKHQSIPSSPHLQHTGQGIRTHPVFYQPHSQC